MGGYYEPSQIFTLYGILALAYFVVNFAISSYLATSLNIGSKLVNKTKKLTLGWFLFV